MPVIDVTNRCNLRCVYCCRGDLSGKEGIEIPFERLVNIINECLNLRSRYFIIQGGEPFLYSHINEFLTLIGERWGYQHRKYMELLNRLIQEKECGNRLKKDYMKILMKCGHPLFYFSSNGLINMPSLIEKLNSSHSIVEISLDSCDNSINQKTRPGSDINIIEKTIKMIRDQNPTSISCTVTENNINDLKNMVEFASDMGCKMIKYSPVLAIGRSKDSYASFIDEYHSQMLKIKDLFSKGKYNIIINFINYENNESLYSKMLTAPNIYIDHHSCSAFRFIDTLYLDPELNVYGCAALKNSKISELGNLYVDEITAIWNSDNRKTMRNLSSQYLYSSGCLSEHIGGDK